MTMTASISVMDLIVLLAGLFAAIFLVAWLTSPRLRVWIERPKHRFLADVQRYEESQEHEPRQPR